MTWSFILKKKIFYVAPMYGADPKKVKDKKQAKYMTWDKDITCSQIVMQDNIGCIQ